MIERLAEFVAGAKVPPGARAVACTAYLDTIGVMLAGSREPSALAVQEVARAEGGTPRCRIIGTPHTTGAGSASLANGTAAHALDYDDMCFVSLAHPSAPLVAAALAAGELARSPGRALLDAWVVGFEIEAILGAAMNPRHYTQGWHCTSTIGTLGAAAAAARLLGLDRAGIARCLGIAASEASGLKENFGTDTKPLHAGLAARNGVMAALLAQAGLTASAQALDGPQGFLKAMGGQDGQDRQDGQDGQGGLQALGRRWEVLETGVTIKLYPSCAGTHPALDVILDLRREHGFTYSHVEAISIGVDAVAPTILIHDRPATGLEGKFSMQFCAAAAVVTGHVGLDTFDGWTDGRIGGSDERIQSLLPRIEMVVDKTLKTGAPALTQSRVTVRLKDGRSLSAYADGARGYPAKPATEEELVTKFRACAGRVLDAKGVEAAIGMLRGMEELKEAGTLTGGLVP